MRRRFVFVERSLDRLGQLVRCIEHATVDVPGRASDRLNERHSRAGSLPCRHRGSRQATFRQVEALAQEVDADGVVAFAERDSRIQLDALQRVDLRVEIARLHLHEQVVGQVLGHLLRQRGHEHPLSDFLTTPDLVQEVVIRIWSAAARPPDRRGRSAGSAARRRASTASAPCSRGGEQQAPAAPCSGTRRSAAAGCRARAAAGSRKMTRVSPETVALVHAADLRAPLMRLVDEDGGQVVLREVVEQRVRPGRSGPGARRGCASLILDPVAEKRLLHHLEVVLGALPDAGAPRRPSPSTRTASPAPRAHGGFPRLRARSSASTSRTASPGTP